MALLVALMFAIRRAVRRLLPVGLALGISGLVVVDTASPLEPALLVSVGCVYGVVLAARARSRLRSERGTLLTDLELGGLLAAGTLACVERLDGDFSGRSYPVVYVLLAFLSAFARPFAVGATVLWLLAIEAGSAYVVAGDAMAASMAAHVVFATAFATLNVIVLRAEIERVRARARSRVDAELGRIRDSARAYRLFVAPSGATEPTTAKPGDEERLLRSSVEEIHEAVRFALELLRRSLGLHTAIVLFQNEAGTHARISEVATGSDSVTPGPFSAGDGVIGAVLVRSGPVVLDGLKPTYRLPYYSGPCPVRSLGGVPVLEHGHARGVLLADRTEGRPFTPEDVEQLFIAARFIARAIENERLFVQLERAKVEQGKLYRAAEALGAARSEGDVVEAGVKSARAVALFDFAAVTLYDEGTRTHEIRAVSGEGTAALAGARFPHNSGLCAMAVQNSHPLPWRGEFDAARQVLFSKQLAAPPMPSILVLPLLVHGRPLGTLVLGAKRRRAFGDAVRPTLEVLASHMAVSLANARMLRKLEEMATTDGLTGLLNKRALLEMAGDKIAAATRFSRTLSVLVTDIDFFKKVNDNFGHDVGDVVIRGIADVLRRMKRTTDAVARFGGEEFVVICEETDSKGAMLLAERVRKEVEAKTFGTEHGPLKVTCSIGVATFPEAGRDWESLFKAADTALYTSKKSGRNRSTAWAPGRKSSAA